MKSYKIFRSARFDKELSKFDKDLHNRVDKIEQQLVNDVLHITHAYLRRT